MVQFSALLGETGRTQRCVCYARERPFEGQGFDDETRRDLVDL
jgi:hypothetical protein